MVKGLTACDKRERCVAPPWTTESEAWQALDQHLPADHLARRIAHAVARLDLTPLWQSYLGVGKKALPPDLLLKVVLYEMHNKRPSPAQWTRDVGESAPVRWLLFGLEPSRAHLYDFRDRLAPFWDEWNAQVLHQAMTEEMTSAARASLDSSSFAAHASRRRLLNEERLKQCRQVIDEHLRCRQRGEPVAEKPGWLADTEAPPPSCGIGSRPTRTAGRPSASPPTKCWSVRRTPRPHWPATRRRSFGRCIPCSCCAMSIRR
jgi:transposase